MRVVVLGATKGIGRALARAMAARGDELFLLGRNLEDLQASVADLTIRAPRSAHAGMALCDLEKPETFEPALDAAEAGLGKLDLVVVTAALFAAQERLEGDPALLHRLLSIDFTNTVLFCEHARKRLMARGGGTLCVFSSVAGERGRTPVVMYGAAKAGLTRYLEGLDHRFRSQGLVTVCVKPGFVRTSMTSGLPPPPFAGSPDRVARQVLYAIDRGVPVVYAPPIWSLIMFVVRLLPRSVMRRVRF
ncbi:MAG TPA: SDR family NAD(P)-dependent oxidoreductase [Vicinamibacterales bacterium]|nr:SDR family NAD(P)-dependent oxidoreductase [Vicinamibacterales bacterium]